MIVKKCKLWKETDHNAAGYTMYLQDNSDEIEAGRIHPAIIVCGGGGYLGISDREKEPVALYFLNKGYQVFVLDYSTAKTGCGTYPVPVYDIAKMILTVRENAECWNIGKDKIAVVGFSAGAHLCASIATQWHEDYLKEKLGVRSELMRPDAVVLAYPVTDCKLNAQWIEMQDANSSPSLNGVGMKEFFEEVNHEMFGEGYDEEVMKQASPIHHVTSDVPPTFVWHTAEDEMVYVVNSIQYVKRLIEEGVDCEFHMFEKGPHGMSLANKQSGGRAGLMDPYVSMWKDLAACFLERHLSL